MDTSEQAASAAPWEGRSARTNFSSLEIMKGLGFARESGSKPTSPPLLATAALTLRAVPAEMEKSDSYKSPVGSKLSHLVNKLILNDAGVCEACCNMSGPF